MAPDALRRIDALIKVGLRLAGTARTGRVVMARVADAIELDWIPRPWGEEIAVELERAAGAAREPLAWRRVQKILRESWGAGPDQVLDELDREPVAVTPGAQVQRGVLDGQPVAVKVLRPGLASAVRQDLTLLEGLLAPLSAAFPALDAGATIAEVKERILDELDLEHEAGIQRRIHRGLRDHPFLTVPAPITRLCHENVLVSEWVDGVPLRDAPDPDQAAERLVVFLFGTMRAGVIHADLVPDDVLVLEDGRLAILDFGASRVLEPGRADLLAAVLDAFSDGDPDQLGEALEALGHAPAELGATALHLAQHALAELAGSAPSRLDSEAVIAARDRLLAEPESLAELIVAGKLPPEDLWPARGAAQLFATIARLGATAPWLELARTALRDGWRAPVA